MMDYRNLQSQAYLQVNTSSRDWHNFAIMISCAKRRGGFECVFPIQLKTGTTMVAPSPLCWHNYALRATVIAPLLIYPAKHGLLSITRISSSAVPFCSLATIQLKSRVLAGAIIEMTWRGDEERRQPVSQRLGPLLN